MTKTQNGQTSLAHASKALDEVVDALLGAGRIVLEGYEGGVVAADPVLNQLRDLGPCEPSLSFTPTEKHTMWKQADRRG